MAGKFGRAAAAALALGMAVGQAQAATGNCWSAQEISAAKVRDLQTILMVAGLRCRASGTDVLAGYNRFVQQHRVSITQFNTQLKAHFNGAHGPREGQRQYDRFTTALANVYGAGGSGAGNCRDMADLAEDATAARSPTALISLADARGLAPELPSSRCAVVYASK